MKSKILLSIVALCLLCGFTSLTEQMKFQLKNMPHHYNQFDVRMGWTVTPGTGGTIISGVIQNVRYAVMANVAVWVTLVDDKGKTLVRSVDYIIPGRLNLDELAVFDLKLPQAAPAGSKWVFTYQYVGLEGGSDGSATNWMQSFETAAGPVN